MLACNQYLKILDSTLKRDRTETGMAIIGTQKCLPY